MKLCTYERNGVDHVGVSFDEESVADITLLYAAYLHKKGENKAFQLAEVMAPPCMVGFINSGPSAFDTLQGALKELKNDPKMTGPKGESILQPMSQIKLKAPVPRPNKTFAIAINNEQKFSIAGLPDGDPHPVYFIKLPTCVIGPYDPIEIPDIGIVGSEIEVAAIIAKKGRFIPHDEAEDYIFGYTVHNDITAHEMRDTREWIISRRPEGDKRLTYSGRYKCFDSFGPMGPWLVTSDSIPDINNCKMFARLNEKVVQIGNTGDMYFKMPYLVSYLSEAHTLEPGDIISWGTVVSPPDVNFQKIDLRGTGGVLESEVEHLGTLKNPIKPI